MSNDSTSNRLEIYVLDYDTGSGFWIENMNREYLATFC